MLGLVRSQTRACERSTRRRESRSTNAGHRRDRPCSNVLGSFFSKGGKGRRAREAGNSGERGGQEANTISCTKMDPWKKGWVHGS